MADNKALFLLTEEQQADFRVRADKDFVRRSISGIILYAVFWPIFCLLTDFHHVHPQFSFWLGLALVAVSGVRYIHLSVGWKLLYQHHYTAWNALLYLLCFVHATLWSLLFVAMIVVPSFEFITLPMLCTYAGIASSANISLMPKFRLSQIYLAILFIPALIACQFNPVYDVAWKIILTFWVYQIFTAKRFWREYYYAFITEAKLELANKTDSLTKLYSRSHFDECLKLQWSNAIRQQSSIALLVIDIDYFKKINDQYGHVAGDECLVHVAQAIKAVAKRATDMVCRYGGEEFVTILTNTDAANACKMAEVIRAEVASNTFVNGKNTIDVTVSIGVHAIKPDSNTDIELLLKHADNALYMAKENGRNRVELAKEK